MRLTRGLLAAAPLALVLLLGGCGTEDGGVDVASAGGEQTEAAENTDGSDQSLSPHEMGVKFAQCMRENGVPMEDPKPGEGIKMTNDGSISQETMEAAQEACREYSPGGNAGPEQQAQMAERAREFAQCMRDNGVEAFQDPDPTKPGIRIDKSVAEDPDFEQAQQTCQELLTPGTGQ